MSFKLNCFWGSKYWFIALFVWGIECDHNTANTIITIIAVAISLYYLSADLSNFFFVCAPAAHCVQARSYVSNLCNVSLQPYTDSVILSVTIGTHPNWHWALGICIQNTNTHTHLLYKLFFQWHAMWNLIRPKLEYTSF